MDQTLQVGKEKNKKKLPIGIENFAEIRTEDFYYVDKTNLIKELLNKWGKVNLFTRPRRFGKSLNMNMLKYFFEYGCDESLFSGLTIDKETDICEKYRGKFPVISISLKDVNGNTFSLSYDLLAQEIKREMKRFQFLGESDKLTSIDKEEYIHLIRREQEISEADLIDSLRLLSELLYKHYHQKVILLIDEYDVPLDKAHQNGYYEEMINLIRNLFSKALKTNDSLYFAVLTGCLRISKESVFTGLNNMQIFTITDIQFDEYFGFTNQEVWELLVYYELTDFYQVMKEWYNGYQFGKTKVYCPWDVLSYCADLVSNKTAKPKNYWLNTSENDLVRSLIKKAKNTTTKREIERLIAGETIVKEIHQNLTYKELESSIDHLWSVLFTTGYLTQQGMADEDTFYLKIPNLEIQRIFIKQIFLWFQEEARTDGKTLNLFCEALKNGDAITVESLFTSYLKNTISIRDTFVKKARKENFYHGILLGLVAYKEDWDVSSNKEAGIGYSDIQIEIPDEEKGIIIEVKYPDDADLEKGCREALKQIRDKDYAQELSDCGVKHILKYGIACGWKKCRVLLQNENIN